MKESKTKWIYVVKTVRVYKAMKYDVILCILGRIHIRGSGWSQPFAREGAKNWPFGEKNWNILTVSRKNVLTVKDF